MPIYVQVSMVILWFFFILEFFTVMHMFAHKKVGVILWTFMRFIPLLFVTLGLVRN